MEVRYITDKDLAELLSLSVKTIRNNTHHIVGRTTIGRSVRYDKELILYTLKQGKDIFTKGVKK